MVYILISTYNGEKYLDEQLKSLIVQQECEVRILVRDDGSKDSTREILETWENRGLLTWYSGTNLGPTGSFMDLLYHAPEADYYAFCDQDDVWLPNKLATAIKKLDDIEDNIKLYCSNLYIWQGEKNPPKRYTRRPTITLKRSLVCSVGTGCTMVFSRGLCDFIKCNKPENMTVLHDLWIYQTSLLFGKVYYDMEPHIFYRQHGENVVGAELNKIKRIYSKIRSITRTLRITFREDNARNLLQCYDELLDDYQKKAIGGLANYKKTFLTRMRLFFSSEYVMNSLMDTLGLKIRILLGAV